MEEWWQPPKEREDMPPSELPLGWAIAWAPECGSEESEEREGATTG